MKETNRRFVQEVLLPILQKHGEPVAGRVTVALTGAGSDVLGLDDELSRDHHWGPRAMVLLPEEDTEAVGALREAIARHLPKQFEDCPVAIERRNLAGVCVRSIPEFLDHVLYRPSLPETEEDWFDLCEVDLLSLTAGEVYFDGAGAWTRVRERLAYYPDRVWRKRVADWCTYAGAREGPYNLLRTARRGDEIAYRWYLASAFRRAMELGFLLNRRYAPYPKWLHRVFVTLPRWADEIDVHFQAVLATGEKQEHIRAFVAINQRYARAAYELGLTGEPKLLPFDENQTDLSLYDTARDISAALPEAWLRRSFSTVESWERNAREVLLDETDFVAQRHK